ncbi:signal peptidase I [Erwinia sp. CPCC 100877]|nr:signal peptidase I [Erwinia sp. CPCC 100877]
MSQGNSVQKKNRSRKRSNRGTSERPLEKNVVRRRRLDEEASVYHRSRKTRERPRKRPEHKEQQKRPASQRTYSSKRRSHPQNYRSSLSKKQAPPQKKVGVQFFSFIWNLVFYGLTIGIIFMALMFSFSSKSTASIFGYRFYTVLTNSMVPQKEGPKDGFYAGDIVIVKLMDGEKVKKNDIVTFLVGDGSRYLTHRVMEKRTELNGEKGAFIVTKGDANNSNDPPVSADRVLGKVMFAVPKAGSILDFIRQEFWACLVFVLSLYGFFLVLKSYLFSPEEQQLSQRRRPVYH